MDSCVFCKIISGEFSCHRVYEDDLTLAFLDIHPVADGHILVVPKHHNGKLQELPIEVQRAVIETCAKMAEKVEKSDLGAQACNIYLNNGAEAGQDVFHTHFHIIPRKAGDHLKLGLSQMGKQSRLDLPNVLAKLV